MKRRAVLGMIVATSGCQTVRYAKGQENSTLVPPLENKNIEFIWTDKTPDEIARGMLYERDTSEELEQRIVNAISEGKIRVQDERRALHWPWPTIYVNRKDAYWEISEKKITKTKNTWSVTAEKVGDLFPEYASAVIKRAVWDVDYGNMTGKEERVFEKLRENGEIEYSGKVPEHVASIRNRIIKNGIRSPKNVYYAEHQNQSGKIRIRKGAPPAPDVDSFED